MAPGGAEGGRSEGGADWLTGRGGVRGSSSQGGAEDQKTDANPRSRVESAEGEPRD